MTTRRSFLKNSVALTAGASLLTACATDTKTAATPLVRSTTPKIISTWNHGIPANNEAWRILQAGGSALDAVEGGVMVVEADPDSQSVGYGGLPDRDGNVTLDACIMDHLGNAGAVCFLQHIMHPIKVARLVMEKTPHVMLAGEGALKFALENGFQKQDLLTEAAKKAWENWLVTAEYKPTANWENHDTIGMIAQDKLGNICGSCTTSGMAYKINGRVGDSPIIGAGLYVDNEVGAAVATGNGELMMKTLGSFLIVEFMRQGMSAQAACEAAVDRIAKKYETKDMQVGYLAMDIAGTVGAYALHPGFNYAHTLSGQTTLIDSPSMEPWA
jgi:isoaspartyl peptidase/L-asparaginase-like protein (Ntn-hydrolase superfamily)